MDFYCQESNKHLGVHVAYEDAEASAHSSALN